MNILCGILLSCVGLISCGNNNRTLISADSITTSVTETDNRPIGVILKENNHLPIKDRIALYYQLKKDNPNDNTIKDEDQLNLYGYSLLWDNKIVEAIEIFKLVVSEFPNSANAYDSLGEAYLANGNREQSLSNYTKSLQLNPQNFNAEDQIDLLNNPNKKPETFADKFSKVYTLQEYKDDLDQLGHQLIKAHPNALKFISKEDFWKRIEEKKALLTKNTTHSEFYWHCSEIIANVNCSHTSMGSYFRESDMPVSLRFPLQTRLIEDRLFVVETTNNQELVKLKDKILSINGSPISELVDEIYKHIASQGFIKTTKRHVFNIWSTAMIPYALGFPETYTVMVKGKEVPIILNPAQSFTPQYDDPSIDYCDEGLCFEVLNDSKTGVLTISSFNYYPWNNLSVFKNFMDTRFKDIKDKDLDNLILDVRFNGGGSPESSIHLLKYIVSQAFIYYSNSNYGALEGEEKQHPFKNAFDGELYFLIDGNGNSTTGHFMSMVKVLKLGTIIGEELGSNQFCTAGQQICRLPNTKLDFYVANSTHETTATSLPDEVGILPDHYVTQSIDNYLNKVDAVKAYAIKLIDEQH